MKKIIIMFVVALLASQHMQAQGTIYLSNFGQISNGNLAVGSDLWITGGFRTGNNADGYLLNSVQLAMTDASGNPSGFSVMLYARSGNLTTIVPGNSLGTLNGSTDPSTSGIYTCTASGLTLSPNTYYFVVTTAGTAIANGAYNWSYTDTSIYNPGDAGVLNVYFYSNNDGSNWHGISPSTFPQFAIDATAIPEPSPSLLLLLGSGVFIYVRRKHKSKARTVP